MFNPKESVIACNVSIIRVIELIEKRIFGLRLHSQNDRCNEQVSIFHFSIYRKNRLRLKISGTMCNC